MKAWAASACGGISRKLAAHTACRVIVWSRAGYGGSEPYPEARTERYMHREGEEMLPALVAALGIEKPILIGHSDGGSIALICAGRARSSRSPWRSLRRTSSSRRKPWPAFALPARCGKKPTGRKTRPPSSGMRRACSATGTIAGCRRPSATGTSRTTCPGSPARYSPSRGEDDEYATMRQIDVIADNVPGTVLLKLPNCGHSPHRDQEAAVLDALVAFVSRASGS